MTEPASGNLIELRVAQLLHALDRFPLRERDLDKEAEESVGLANWLISFEHDGGSQKATNQYLKQIAHDEKLGTSVASHFAAIPEIKECIHFIVKRT